MKYWQAHTDLPTHPKRFKFERALGTETGLHYLFLWFNMVALHSKEGDITHLDAEEIARLCEWKGKPELLREALVKSEFLDILEDGRLICHNWKEENGYYIRENKRLKKAMQLRRKNASVTRNTRVQSAIEGEGEVKENNKKRKVKTEPSAHPDFEACKTAFHNQLISNNKIPEYSGRDFKALRLFLAGGKTGEDFNSRLPNLTRNKFAAKLGFPLWHYCQNFREYSNDAIGAGLPVPRSGSEYDPVTGRPTRVVL